MAFEVNSVPWSETIMSGLPRRLIRSVSSRATRRPEIDVSGIAAKHSRVTSSTMLSTPPAGELVVHEVQGPARVRSCLDQDRRSCAHRSSPRPALANRQPFFLVEPIDAVDAGWLAFPPQQDEQPPIAEAPSFIGKVA